MGGRPLRCGSAWQARIIEPVARTVRPRPPKFRYVRTMLSPLLFPVEGSSLRACLLIWLAVTGGSDPIAGQVAGEPRTESTPAGVASRLVTGTIRDANTQSALPGARIRIDELRRGTLSDDFGRFMIDDVEPGLHVITVERYGYASAEGTIDTRPESGAVLEIELLPMPVMLDGLSVVTDRLELMETRLRSRRNAVPYSSRAFGQDRLVRSPARDMLDFLVVDASLSPVRCGAGRLGNWCVVRRGRPVEPRVYIDEAPVIGGLDQLQSYQPHDLYLIEVYSLGQEIRAYTHQFVERMARRPVALIPIGVGR